MTVQRRRCPGLCTKQIPPHLFACSGCWNQLPQPLRTRNNHRMRATPAEIARDINDWFLGVVVSRGSRP